MPGKKQQSPSPVSRVAGGVLGALAGAIWAFLRTWQASAEYFNRQGRGLVVVGVLLGWVPGLLAAVVGLAYGLWKGGKMGFIDGILATLQGIEEYIEKFGNRPDPGTGGSGGRPLDWQRLELLPTNDSEARIRARPSELRQRGHHSRAAAKEPHLSKKVKMMEHKQVRFFDPEEPPIHVGPLAHEKKRGRSPAVSSQAQHGRGRGSSPPPTYNPPSRRKATSASLYMQVGSRKTAKQLAEEAKHEKPAHHKHKRRSRSASPG